MALGYRQVPILVIGDQPLLAIIGPLLIEGEV
jgi:hypothetical protein